MTATRALNITLPDDIARIVEQKVASGEFKSASDVLREGVIALEEREFSIDTWLRDEVGPTYDRVMDGQAKLHSGDEVFGGLEARYDARKAKPGK